MKAVAIELNEAMTDEELIEMLQGANGTKNAAGHLAVSDSNFK